MAKQKGIHQLKGKVGEMSYYQSAGVPGGLVRRIPEGLSNRVKTGDEYANTRLNNEEFKQANALATFAFNAVAVRKTSMMRRFAIARMTKSILAEIKQGDGGWGKRIPVTNLSQVICDALEKHAKSGVYDGEFGTLSVSETSNPEQQTVELISTPSLYQDFVDRGLSGFDVYFVSACVGEDISGSGDLIRIVSSSLDTHITDVRLLSMEAPSVPLVQYTVDPNSNTTFNLRPVEFNLIQEFENQGYFAIMTMVPYRTINGVKHPIFEYATFVAIPFGSIPEQQ